MTSVACRVRPTCFFAGSSFGARDVTRARSTSTPAFENHRWRHGARFSAFAQTATGRETSGPDVADERRLPSAVTCHKH
jgi:hypothetical protein